MKEQLNRYNQLDTEGRIKNQFSLLNNTNEISTIFSSNPMLKLNPNIKDFYEFTIDDILLENYNHMGKLEMEVSV
jgi:thymidylate synthase